MYPCALHLYYYYYLVALSIFSRSTYFQYALAGDDHFAVVACFVRTNTPAFIFILSATSGVYRIAMTWCPMYVSRTACDCPPTYVTNWAPLLRSLHDTYPLSYSPLIMSARETP
ncbi:hypothetical protein EDD17DRAFT_710857 [Pisolithus thermaeus]|nr:hypothetical protein EDD17DRAFT_710857 [Pisolithus thermaeus]